MSSLKGRLQRASRRAKRKLKTVLRKLLMFNTYNLHVCNSLTLCRHRWTVQKIRGLDIYPVYLCVRVCVFQAFQLPTSLRGLAEPDFKMLPGEHRKDSGLLEYRLSIHAVCGRCKEGTASPSLVSFH